LVETPAINRSTLRRAFSALATRSLRDGVPCLLQLGTASEEFLPIRITGPCDRADPAVRVNPGHAGDPMTIRACDHSGEEMWYKANKFLTSYDKKFLLRLNKTVRDGIGRNEAEEEWERRTCR
jgi:hypothetical protein